MIRKFIFSMFCLSLVSGVHAETNKNPYYQIKSVESEWRTVRLYYVTSCPYSRAFLPFFKNLSITGSSQTKLAFEPTPILNRADGQLYFLTYAAVRRFHPEKVWNFVEASIKGNQDSGMNMYSPNDLSRILIAAGMKPLEIRDEISKNRSTLYKDIKYLGYLQNQYFMGKDSEKLAITPSIVVAGTYITNPNLVMGGSSENFSVAVNALISMVSQ